jgi:hypothetical protein
VLIGKAGLDSDILRRLLYTVHTSFNSYAKQDLSTCLPNTRVGLLQEIYNWVDSEDERCIFWLNGLAGTGKSTIARTITRRYFEQKRLGASSFFSRGGGDVGHAGKFFTSIAVQLAHNALSFRQYISEATEEQIDIAGVGAAIGVLAIPTTLLCVANCYVKADRSESQSNTCC